MSLDDAARGGSHRARDHDAAARRPVVPPPLSQARPPHQSWDVVERPRLLRRITHSVERAPLTLIRAPAGTGKTVLAADWARRADRGRPVAWLTMAQRDNHPGVFWTHLQLALATVGAIPRDDALRPLFPDDSDIDALSARLLGLATPVVLVVDAAERLQVPAVYDQVRRLIDTGGDRFRVVMTSRVEPPLPLHRDRVEDRVAEIRAEELALSRDEVDAVLVRHHLSPTPELSEEVLRRTEGWAAGVRLAALQIASDGPEAGLDGFATAYLRAEVLAGLSPSDREVLTATTVVDDLPPGLAPALTERRDADDRLRALASGNGFVLPVRGHPAVLRLHPLVRELLRADLDRDAPDSVAVLHRRAAAWFEDRGDLEPAVRHHVAAGDWPRAVARVMTGGGLAEIVVDTPTGAALADDLAAAPDTGSFEASVLRAALALRAGDLARSRAELERGAGRPDTQPARAAAALVWTAWHEAADRPAQTLEAAGRARSALAALEAADPLTVAAVAVAEGTAHLRCGDLEAACTSLGDAVATVSADSPVRLRCLADLALAEACSGHLTRSTELVEAAEQAAADRDVAVGSRPMAIELARAWVALERQNLRRARRSLDRVGRSRARDDDTSRTIALLLRARYLRDRGDLAAARRLLGRAEPTATWLRGHLDAERQELEGQEPAYGAGTPDHRVRELLAQTDRECRAGDLAAARQHLARALQLARAERVRRPFVHAAPRVWALIRGDARVRPRAEWLRPDELDVDPQESPTAVKPVLEPLTERELQVLRHLAAFRTTEEIAAELFISVHTVRTHVRRVLEKLSVSRRHEAVRRGQELGLV